MRVGPLIVLCLAGIASAQAADPEFFAPDADSSRAVAAALDSARQSNRRALVIYEGSWCKLCPRISEAIEGAGEPFSHYIAVHVKTGDLDGLRRFAKEQGAKLDAETGPLVVVLDRDGAIVSAVTAQRLTKAGAVAPDQIARFLARWAPAPPASDMFESALPALRASGKAGFVMFRADWCGYCHKLTELFEKSSVAPILQEHYLLIPVDLERNEGAIALSRRLGSSGREGLPWFAVIDAAGKPLITSNGPKGNIGFPVSPEERAHFAAILRATAKGIAEEDLARIEQLLTKPRPAP